MRLSIPAFFPALCLCAALCPVLGPSPDARADEPALSVAVTIPPQAYFVDKVAGDLARATILVPAGADPHSYEPKPSQVAELAGADLWLCIGVEFERAWTDRLLSANPDLVMAAMDAGIEKRTMASHAHHAEEHHAEEHHHEAEHHEHHDHAGLDPHVWTAPPLVRVLAANAAQALIRADPAHEAAYRANLAAFQAELDGMHARFSELFSSLPPDKRVFLVYHPAWGYFADAYGLTQVVVQAEGKDPGARELMELIDFATAHHVGTVFVQPQFSDKAATVVAEAIHGNVVKADPLARDWADNMERVARAFRQAMQQE